MRLNDNDKRAEMLGMHDEASLKAYLRQHPATKRKSLKRLFKQAGVRTNGAK